MHLCWDVRDELLLGQIWGVMERECVIPIDRAHYLVIMLSSVHVLTHDDPKVQINPVSNQD